MGAAGLRVASPRCAVSVARHCCCNLRFPFSGRRWVNLPHPSSAPPAVVKNGPFFRCVLSFFLSYSFFILSLDCWRQTSFNPSKADRLTDRHSKSVFHERATSSFFLRLHFQTVEHFTNRKHTAGEDNFIQRGRTVSDFTAPEQANNRVPMRHATGEDRAFIDFVIKASGPTMYSALLLRGVVLINTGDNKKNRRGFLER